MIADLRLGRREGILLNTDKMRSFAATCRLLIEEKFHGVIMLMRPSIEYTYAETKASIVYSIDNSVLTLKR